MAARAGAGEMRTKITVKNPEYSIIDGFSQEEFKDVFSRPVWCKWVYAHGSEVYEGAAQRLREPATITMRFSPLVTAKSRIWRGNDPTPYEVISLNNVNDRGEFLEIKVQRVVTA